MRQFTLFFLLLGFLKMAFAQQETLIYPYAYQDQWGLVDQDRMVVLPPSLDSIGFFYTFNQEAVHPRLAVAVQNDKLGAINTEGEWVLKPKVDSIGRSQYDANGLAWVVRKGKYGLMDFNGQQAKWLIKPRFTEVSRLRGRKVAVAVVGIDDRWGVVNSEGEFVAKCKYDEVKLLHAFSDYPDIKLTKGGQTTYIDALGNARDVEGLVWEDGDIVLEDDMIEEDYFDYDRWTHRIVKESLAGGRQQISLEASREDSPYERVEQRILEPGYAIFNLVVDESARPPRIKYLMVQKEGKVGFWGPNGLIAPGAIYDRITWTSAPRYGELAVLYRNGLKGFARANGELLVPAAFTTLEARGSLLVFTHPDGYRGYADGWGRVFLPKEVDLE